MPKPAQLLTADIANGFNPVAPYHDLPLSKLNSALVYRGQLCFLVNSAIFPLIHKTGIQTKTIGSAEHLSPALVFFFVNSNGSSLASHS